MKKSINHKLAPIKIIYIVTIFIIHQKRGFENYNNDMIMFTKPHKIHIQLNKITVFFY